MPSFYDALNALVDYQKSKETECVMRALRPQMRERITFYELIVAESTRRNFKVR
jgi:hypothetical protein